MVPSGGRRGVPLMGRHPASLRLGATMLPVTPHQAVCHGFRAGSPGSCKFPTAGRLPGQPSREPTVSGPRTLLCRYEQFRWLDRGV